LNIIEKMNCGFNYYSFLIDNVELDVKNPKNSYVLWLFEKVDNLDFNKPVQYIKGNISLPDIDTDFSAQAREEVIEYIYNKYGYDNCAGILSYQNLQGKAALKEILRIHDACSFTEMNKITQNIPHKDK